MNKTPEEWAAKLVRVEMVRSGYDRDDREYVLKVAGVVVDAWSGSSNREEIILARSAMIGAVRAIAEDARNEALMAPLAEPVSADDLAVWRHSIESAKPDEAWAAGLKVLLADRDYLARVLADLATDEPQRTADWEAGYRAGVEAAVKAAKRAEAAVDDEAYREDTTVIPWVESATADMRRAVESVRLPDSRPASSS